MDDPGEVPGPDASAALERLLLDGPRRYTRLQVAALAGMAPERTQRLWRALGFADAEASIARAMGQALSRLADWQADMLADALTRGGPGGDRRPASPEEAVAVPPAPPA